MAKKSKKQVSKAMCADEYTPKRYAPRVTFSEDDIKGLKDLKVGDTHDITIKAKLVSLRQDEYGWEGMDGNGDKLQGTFKVIMADNKNIENNYDDEED